jgi:malate/lactate dehydrogenase
MAYLHQQATLHIVGLGDVGGTLLMGMMLCPGPFTRIGIYDPDENRCLRFEQEMNQVLPPYGEAPGVFILRKEALFDCDAFAFTASAGVPAAGAQVTDVRMMQLTKNRQILTPYALDAVKAGYRGLFFQVSDPVDLLCQTVRKAGVPENQIIGCGLGVMLARAAYCLRKRGFTGPMPSVRAFGPHGKGLVIANATDEKNYDDHLSRLLSREVTEANLRVRETGYKPYLAPGLSSGCRTIVRAVEGDWFDGSICVEGTFFGCRARLTSQGFQREQVSLHPLLEKRVEDCFEEQRLCQKD